MASRRAFSLLEVILATALFSIVMVTGAGAWALHHQAITSNASRSTAVFLALQELNSRIAKGYPNLAPTTAGSPITSDFSVNTASSGRTVVTTYRTTVTIQEDATTKFRRILVQVGWSEARGPQSIAYEVYLHPSSVGIQMGLPAQQTSLNEPGPAY